MFSGFIERRSELVFDALFMKGALVFKVLFLVF